MAEMWYGGSENLKSSRPWWLFLNVWCLFEVVLFPISFFAAFVLGNVINHFVYTIGQSVKLLGLITMCILVVDTRGGYD